MFMLLGMSDHSISALPGFYGKGIFSMIST